MGQLVFSSSVVAFCCQLWSGAYTSPPVSTVARKPGRNPGASLYTRKRFTHGKLDMSTLWWMGRMGSVT